MKTKRFRPVLWAVAGTFGLFLIGGLSYLVYHQNITPYRVENMRLSFFPRLGRAEVAAAIGRQRLFSRNLQNDTLALTIKGKSYTAKLNLDVELQAKVEDVFNRYNPDYAAFVAIDPATGKILAMNDYSMAGHTANMNLRATFPAASVFKVVTSAAALEEKKLQPQSLIAWNGSAGTLYKRNLREQVTRWTRYISVEEALAKSINTVFAKIAMNRLGPETLQKYANSFGFNRTIAFDMPVDASSAIIPNDSYGLAESGSGFTRRQTMSPLQAALLAASIINGGNMPDPQLVDSITDERGNVVYKSTMNSISHPIDPETARTLSMMMENTITMGTAKKYYRDYNHHPLLSKLFIGAKTGSLSGDNPEGRYEWFVGFAQASDNPTKKIAFAALTISKQFWKVKSARVAREAIIQFFKNKTSL